MNLEAGQQECQRGNICNSTEARFVANLAEEVKFQLKSRNLADMTIGILTFYQGQKHAIKKALPRSSKIDVKTVDGYQVSSFSLYFTCVIIDGAIVIKCIS